MDIIDINKERKKKIEKDGAPSNDCHYTDCGGIDWYLFNVNYCYQDTNWNFKIWAKSIEDANMRISAIKRLPVEITQILHEERS